MTQNRPPGSGPEPISPEAIIRMIPETIQGASAKEVLQRLVQAIATVLHADGAFVGELLPNGRQVRTVAQVANGKPVPSVVYDLPGTPGETVLASGTSEGCVFQDRIREQFPEDPLLADMNARACVVIPLLNRKGNAIGLITLLYPHPLPAGVPGIGTLPFFATLTASELERMHLEEELCQARDYYRRFFEHDITGDYISTPNGRLVDANPAFLQIFGFASLEEARTVTMDSLFISPGHRDTLLDRLRRERQIRNLEIDARRKDGTPIRTRENIIGVFDTQGELVSLWGYVMDITAESRAQQELVESQARYQGLFTHNPDGIVVADVKTGRLVEVNPAFEELAGRPRAKLIGMHQSQLHPPEQEGKNRADFLQHVREARQHGTTSLLRQDLVRPDGTRVPVEIKADLVTVGGRQTLQGVFRDIRERVQADLALRESERKYRSILEDMQESYYEVDLAGNLTFFNDSLCRLLGYPRDELLGMNDRSYTDEENAKKLYRAFNQVYQTGEPTMGLDWEIIRKDGTRRTIEASVSLKKDSSGVPIGFQGIIRDVTLQKQTEQKLQESEEKFRTLAESMPVGVMIYNESGFVYANPAALAICQYSSEELARMPFWEMVHPDHRDMVRKRGMARLRGDSPKNRYEFKIVRKDGDIRWIDFTGTRIHYAGKPAGIIVVQDITERKQKDTALRTLTHAVHQAPIAVIITDTEGTITFVNDGFEVLTGFPRREAMGQNPRILKSDQHPQKLYKEMWDTITAGRTWHGELCNRRKDGSLFWVQAVISPVLDRSGHITQYVGVQLDITERKRLEQERNEMEMALQQAQKLETIGTLAGGIAHDFNNILTPILGYAQLARTHIPADSPANKQVARIEQAAYRARDLIQQILTFSRRVEPTRQPIHPAPLIKEALKLLRASIPSSITIETRIDPDTDMVMADPTQLHQVLMNLCTNAFHAMEESGGTLTVTLNTRPLTREEQVRTGLSHDRCMALSVEDTGCGIPPEVQKRIFEPFFTTKPSGKGTGMGLSVVHGIVTSHGGGILVDSTVGAGTTVTVFLPTASKPEASAARPAKLNVPSTGQGRLLIVDDEEIVRQTHQEGLRTLGYDVVAAADGQEALHRFQEDPDAFDLVLTDLTMPRMSGFELATQLHSLRPDLPILLITGYNEELTEDMATASGIRAVLRKPCPIRELHAAVHRALHAD